MKRHLPQMYTVRTVYFFFLDQMRNCLGNKHKINGKSIFAGLSSTLPMRLQEGYSCENLHINEENQIPDITVNNIGNVIQEYSDNDDEGFKKEYEVHVNKVKCNPPPPRLKKKEIHA